MANRHRPRRGGTGSNILVSGDTGTTAGPQGGAQPGATESGDLEAREFGVPQADVPGGLRHKVNPEAVPADTADKPRRPADYHKYHGVPSDDGQYAVTPGTEHDKPPKAAPEPKFTDAVPVYNVEAPGHDRRIRSLVAHGPLSIAAGTVDPVRLCARDPYRHKLYITCEVTTGTLRINSNYEQLSQGFGFKLSNTTSLVLMTFDTQDAVWIINSGGQVGTISWAEETEIPVTDSGG